MTSNWRKGKAVTSKSYSGSALEVWKNLNLCVTETLREIDFFELWLRVAENGSICGSVRMLQGCIVVKSSRFRYLCQYRLPESYHEEVSCRASKLLLKSSTDSMKPRVCIMLLWQYVPMRLSVWTCCREFCWTKKSISLMLPRPSAKRKNSTDNFLKQGDLTIVSTMLSERTFMIVKPN